ncbi:unnamed protein product [Adineta steineri]|uniref:Tetratricopeptide repeat protein n=1 Tax=Adineta steineri TaxID=433720 RepID=A0A814Z4S1_9BILA|nr:unnamed protein product [Adineta steineri]CAF1526544.1 unnamed protein product [Adineta steineri]
MQSRKAMRLEKGGDLLTLGHILKDLGNYSKAGEFYQRLVNETTGINSIQKAAGLTGLGNVAKAQGDYSNAKLYYEQALELKRSWYRDDLHSDLAVNFNNMGLVCRHLGQLREAVGYHKHALAIRKKVIEDNQQSGDTAEYRRIYGNVADSHGNLATVYFEQGQIQLAWEHVRESLSINKLYLTSDDPKIAIDYRLIGLLRQSEKEYSKAKVAYEKAFAIQKKVLGRHHVETAATQCCLGALLWNNAQPVTDTRSPLTEAMMIGYRYCFEGMSCFDKFGLPPDHRYRKLAKLVLEQYEQICNQSE